ncbi:MAG: RNA-binding protein [Verrucomicrobiales bacterium]|nr:RNA-binding protein [Verrucomicrobiales bacterium]
MGIDAGMRFATVVCSTKKEQCRCQVDRLSSQPRVAFSDSARAGLPLGFLSGKSNIEFMSESRLFVGNLSYQTTENDLQDYFAQAGAVTSVNLMMDKFTGKSRGFAFVEMANPADATKAVEMLHGKELQGRALTVNIARPREERPPRSSGGGGGGYRDREGGGRSERY